MKVLSVEKVTALPSTFAANTQYFVPVSGEPTLIDMYVSSTDGSSAKHIITKAEITTLINQAISTLSGTVVVADIAARDALAPTTVTTVLVLDATGDSTVASGAATYIYNPSTTSWNKISEAESMDFIVSWASITGGPTSTAAQIDAAVAASHTHSNMVVLDALTDVSGALYYSGQPVNGNIVTEAW